MSDPIALNYNTDQSRPVPLPVLTEAQKAAFGPFPATTTADAVAVMNHLLEISMSAGEPIEIPAETDKRKAK